MVWQGRIRHYNQDRTRTRRGINLLCARLDVGDRRIRAEIVRNDNFCYRLLKALKNPMCIRILNLNRELITNWGLGILKTSLGVPFAGTATLTVYTSSFFFAAMT